MIKNFTLEETTAFSKAILGEKTGAIKVFYRTGQTYLVTCNIEGTDCKGFFHTFINSESKGKFYNQMIKNNPNFTVTRIEN